MKRLTEKDYKDIAGWQKHMRRTAQDENISKSTRRKINYRIGLLDRLIKENERLEQSRHEYRQTITNLEAKLKTAIKVRDEYHLKFLAARES